MSEQDPTKLADFGLTAAFNSISVYVLGGVFYQTTVPGWKPVLDPVLHKKMTTSAHKEVICEAQTHDPQPVRGYSDSVSHLNHSTTEADPAERTSQDLQGRSCSIQPPVDRSKLQHCSIYIEGYRDA